MKRQCLSCLTLQNSSLYIDKTQIFVDKRVSLTPLHGQGVMTYMGKGWWLTWARCHDLRGQGVLSYIGKGFWLKWARCDDLHGQGGLTYMGTAVLIHIGKQSCLTWLRIPIFTFASASSHMREEPTLHDQRELYSIKGLPCIVKGACPTPGESLILYISTYLRFKRNMGEHLRFPIYWVLWFAFIMTELGERKLNIIC